MKGINEVSAVSARPGGRPQEADGRADSGGRTAREVCWSALERHAKEAIGAPIACQTLSI